MAFIQIIEITTDRLDEVESVMDQWVSRTEGRRRAHHATLTADRDRPGTYIQIVEFPSYEDAMANSALPETDEFAAESASLCEGAPEFRNLDVRRVDELS